MFEGMGQPSGAAKKRILCCDGGGVRAIITLRCLQAFEKHVGASCHDYFDMFAGTSAGAEVAALLALGTTVDEAIGLLRDRRAEMFVRTPLSFLHPLVTKYQKKPIHRFFMELYGADRKLRDLDRDILITAVDTVRSETTFFTSFRLPGGGRHGTYRDVRVRDAVEASAAAPTYFQAHGRFVDGGVGAFNNPGYVAAVEALRYSSDREREPSAYDGAELEVYSFGTGLQMHAMAPDEAMGKSGIGWALYALGEGGDQAGRLQSYVAQSELEIAERVITFYRYDLYLTDAVIQQAAPGATIGPDELTLDAYDDERFALLDRLGSFYAAYLARNNFFIQPSLASTVAAPSHAAIVREGRSSTRWDEYGKPPLPADYVQQVLAQFDAVDSEFD